MQKVSITRRTGDGLLTRSGEMQELAKRFRAVGSRGRAQQLEDVAAILRALGLDLKRELAQRERRTLEQIGPPRLGER